MFLEKVVESFLMFLNVVSGKSCCLSHVSNRSGKYQRKMRNMRRNRSLLKLRIYQRNIEELFVTYYC